VTNDLTVRSTTNCGVEQLYTRSSQFRLLVVGVSRNAANWPYVCPE